MALMFCQDCGTQISTEATACPKCGRATKQKPGFSILRVLGMLFILLVLVNLLFMAKCVRI
jgi:hypothetical protein